MASVWRDLLFLLPSSAVVLLVLIKPDIPTVIGAATKAIFFLAAAVFVIHVLSLLKKFLKSSFVRDSPSNTIGENNPELTEALNEARQNAQASYNDQVARYQEEVLLPRQEEIHKMKEKKFYRFTGLPWASPGHALGGTNDISESSIRQRASSGASRTEKSESYSKQSPSGLESQSSSSSETERLSLPDEPEANFPNTVSIALKTPQGRTHKRRFVVTERIETLQRCMTSVGYHPKLYALYFSYPRQPVLDDPNTTLEELGIIHDVLLNIEEKDQYE